MSESTSKKTEDEARFTLNLTFFVLPSAPLLSSVWGLCFFCLLWSLRTPEVIKTNPFPRSSSFDICPTDRVEIANRGSTSGSGFHSGVGNRTSMVSPGFRRTGMPPEVVAVDGHEQVRDAYVRMFFLLCGEEGKKRVATDLTGSTRSA